MPPPEDQILPLPLRQLISELNVSIKAFNDQLIPNLSKINTTFERFDQSLVQSQTKESSLMQKRAYKYVRRQQDKNKVVGFSKKSQKLISERGEGFFHTAIIYSPSIYIGGKILIDDTAFEFETFSQLNTEGRDEAIPYLWYYTKYDTQNNIYVAILFTNEPLHYTREFQFMLTNTGTTDVTVLRTEAIWEVLKEDD